MKQQRHSITFDLPPGLKSLIVKAATDRMTSVSAYIRQVLAKNLNRDTKRKGQPQ